ncbi:MAG: hypothetical protein LBH70_05230 [Spirochaetaceae bacterium]|jgi:hypothetical protein|nr:hypothetical protein [Spirochaetaceae bacterium]
MKQIACAVFLLCSGLAGVNAQRDTPVWVNRPSAVFPDSLFVSASGSGQDRSRAESSALGSLTAYFKQSVVNTITLKDSERQENGRSSSSTEAFQTIEAVSALDSLIGAEIKAVWNDERQKLWYAVAVMEKAKCAPRYSEEINKALVEINDLIDISKGVSFETISKCRRAQESLDKAGVLVLVHSMLGGWNRQDELAALSARITAALDQAKSIPVDVRVLSGDRGGRIRSAFAGIFTSAGFRTGSRNSRYTLEVTMTLSEAPKTQFYNTRYGINAVLKDTLNDMELFTYTITNRESHTQSQAEADNRAYIGAERKIKAEFPEVLREYMESY